MLHRRNDDFHSLPAWQYNLKQAFLQALPPKRKWHIVSITSSDRSNSKYVYLYRKEHLFPIRIANHFNWQRGLRAYAVLKYDPLKSVRQAAADIRDLLATGRLQGMPFGQVEWLLLQMVNSTQERFDPTKIVMNNDRTVTVKYSRMGGPFTIVNKEFTRLILRLRKVRLLIINHYSGQISVSHNGRDILYAYPKLRNNDWRKQVRKYDWLGALHLVDELLMARGNPSLIPAGFRADAQDPQADMAYYEQLFNLTDEDSQGQPADAQLPVKQTPKQWREEVIEAVRRALPYGTVAVATTALPRRRVVYFQLARDNRLYTIRVGERKQERTRVSYTRADTNIIADGKGWLDRSGMRSLGKFRSVPLTRNMYLWLRVAQLCEAHDWRLKPSTTGANIVVERELGQLTIYPVSSRHVIDLIAALGWIELGPEGYRLTPLGVQAMTNYHRVALNHRMDWSLQVPKADFDQLAKYGSLT